MGQRLRVLDHGVQRHDSDLAIGPVIVLREGGHHIDLVAHGHVGHVRPHGVDDASGLVAQNSGEAADRLDIIVLTPHTFGAIDANRLDLDADLGPTRSADLFLDKPQDFRTASAVELDHTGHFHSPEAI